VNNQQSKNYTTFQEGMNKLQSQLLINPLQTDGKDSLKSKNQREVQTAGMKTELTTGTTWCKLSELMKRKKVKESTDLEIAETLMKIYVLIGLRKQHQPSQFEFKTLLEFIRETYGRMAKDELMVAFKLAVKGRLDIEDINPYDQFSPVYLEKIMRSYRTFVNKAYQEPEPINSNMIEYKISTEEKLADIEQYRNSTLRTSLLPIYLYDWMIELGLISISNDEKINLTDQAFKIREDQLMDEAMLNHDRREYRRFIEYKKNGFMNLPFSEVAALDSIYKKLVIKKFYAKDN
jgi:hypothetical protein